MLEDADALGGRSGKAGTRREIVLKAARRLVTENGVHAASMSSISVRSGVSVQQIYRDFICKEGLVLALAETQYGRVPNREALALALDRKDCAAIRSWLQDFVRNADCRPDAQFAAEIIAEATRNPAVAAIVATAHERLRSCLRYAVKTLYNGNADQTDVVVELIMVARLGCRRLSLFSDEGKRPFEVGVLLAWIERTLPKPLSPDNPPYDAGMDRIRDDCPR